MGGQGFLLEATHATVSQPNAMVVSTRCVC
jgi:hypothetical protein